MFDDDSDLDLSSEIETITITYRDENDDLIEEFQFDITIDDGLRFQWWANSQGFGKT
jgi:hypothetical protein